MDCPAHTLLWKSVLLRKIETLGRGTIGPKAWDRRVNTGWFSLQLENLQLFLLGKKKKSVKFILTCCNYSEKIDT